MESKNVYSVLDNWKTFFRLILFIIILFGLIYAGLYLFIFSTKSNLQITITETGATVIKKNNQTVTAQFLLPASARWTNTGIRFEPNSLVEITASGMVHLGLKSLYDAADHDRRPPYSWCSPAGLDIVNPRARDNERWKFLINPNAKMGTIIGYLQKDGEPDPGFQNPRPDNLITIYENTKINFPNYSTTLWLIVNDVMLDSKRLVDSKSAYFGPEEELIKEKKLSEKDSSWAYITSTGYWDIWYDDNLGNYLIQLKVKDK